MSSFLQTREWGAFQETLGRKTFFIRGEAWEALLIRHALPLGFNYLYCPRGPVLVGESRMTNNELRNKEIAEEFLIKAVEVAKKEKSIFLRWDPGFLDTECNFKTLQVSSFKFHETRSVQPRVNAVLDLLPSEEHMLSVMHEKTRYNIRLAQRKGVVVREIDPERGIEAFWRLLRETSERDEFTTHPREHYEALVRMFSARAEEPFLRLYAADIGGETLAMALVVFYRGTATYLHGASASARREVMAPHLLHWHIAQEAKRMGYASYDLGGVDEKNPRWAGITRFKRGFGAENVRYAPSADVIFSRRWYAAYRLARRLF